MLVKSIYRFRHVGSIWRNIDMWAVAFFFPSSCYMITYAFNIIFRRNRAWLRYFDKFYGKGCSYINETIKLSTILLITFFASEHFVIDIRKIDYLMVSLVYRLIYFDTQKYQSIGSWTSIFCGDMHFCRSLFLRLWCFMYIDFPWIFGFLIFHRTKYRLLVYLKSSLFKYFWHLF